MHSKLLSFVSFALLAWASPPIQVSLKTSWPAPPFLLELLETISLETPDSFAHLVDLVTNPNVLPNPDTLSPEALLHATLEIAGEAGFLSKHGSLAAVQMNLALHSATPRIQAMFDYFEHRGARPEGKCQEAWVDWYGQHVCDIESLVQLTGHETIDSANSLQTDPFERPKLLPLDHIYPSPDRLVHRPPRTAILYGSLTSPKFRELHTHLYGMASAELPHIEYVIRPIPPAKATSSPLFLSGYGVSLDLKKTDYLAVDDRLVRQDAQRGTSEEVVETTDLISELFEQFPEVESGIDLSAAPTSEELKDVGAKAVQLIMTSPQPFSVLKQLSQNFPKYASALVKRVAVNESIDLELQENAGLIGPGTNALWLNGAQVEEKDMTPHGLLRLLNKERDAVLSLVGPDKLEDAGKAVQLLSDEKLGASLLTTPGLDGIFDASDRPESGDVIIWWNNIETEERYSKWATNLRSLLRPLFPGQFPQIKANMYNVVMVADLAKMSALNLIAGPMASIIERGYPFTFGFVPDLETEEGRALAHLVSYLVEKQGSKAALDFLKKISQVHVPPAHRSTTIDWDLVRRGFLKAAESTEGGDQIDFDAIMNGENSQLPVDKIAAYIRRLGATQEDSPVGHGFVNGKHLRLDDDFLRNFQMEVGQQIQHFQEQVHYGKLTDKNFSALSTYYYDLPSTSQRRNPYIFPTPSGPGRLRFANIPELTSRCTLRTESNIFLLPTLHSTTLAPVTVYVIADLDSRSGRHLVNEALLALSNQDSMVPFRLALLHNPEDVEEDDMPDRLPTSWYIAYLIHKGQMATTDPAQLMKAMDTFARAPSLGHAEDAFKDLTSGVTLASIDPAVHHRMLAEGRLVARKLELSPGEQGMIVNGRVIGPIDSGRFSADDLNTLVEYEYLRRTQPLMNALDEIDSSILAKDNSVVSSLLFEAGATISALQLADPSEVGLFDTPQRPRSRAYERLAQVYTGFRMGDNATAMYHLSVVINPLNVKAQKLISLVEWLSNVPNIYIEVRLNPRATNEMPLKQFYRYNVQSILTFDNTGAEISPAAVFEDLPTEPIYTLAMDVPPSWLVRPREALYDLDNIQLGQLAPEDKSLDATFQLDYLVVEGHARDVQSGAPPRGLQLELLDGDGAPIDDTLVVANLGYLQFKARPGVFTLDIRPGRGREVFSLESVGSEGWFSPPVSESGSDITVASFEGVTLYPRLSRNEGMEAVDVLEDTGEVEDSNLFQRVKSLFQSNPDAERQAEINIFTVASGLLYERFASIMILSVLRNTKHTVKFWFIENFLSPSFLEFIPHFAKEYKFDYELVTYKWPSWLRAQTEKQRIIWAYKILFLDVLFPMDLKKVIFVDADQIVRADLKELVDVDLQGAPYGYTPMGDDSYDMDGFRFWKTGYWKDFLGGLPYHISALYVVDLVRFRQMAAGDMLRGHYQQLSADPNSLANLDQDLPNNLQRQVPIFSLHEDWLWCETWCSKDRLHRAKTIDLCQNPLTKEPKLSRARQIPEWEHYDAEIWNFTKKLAEQGLIHSRVAAADTNILAGSKESKPEPESHATEESEVHHKPEVSSTDRQESQEFPKDELCVPCLRNTVDITEGIPKQASVSYCRNCERFLSPPQTWTIARPESPELLAICLRKLKGLNKVRLTDAHFIWTEPHSKRLRVSLTIQKEVLTSTILEQTFEIEYLVQYGQCSDCAKLAAKNTWKALVQVRQKVSHKRTFLYLEQLILKHGAQKDTISVKEVRDGLDFFYSQRSHAIKMVEFLNGVVPIKSKGSEQLLSQDTHSNTANYKFTYSVEIVPICKDDLVCLPLKQARSLSNVAPLVLCTRVGSSLQLLDPIRLQTVELPSNIYWRSPVDSLTNVTDLVEFTVLDIDPEYHHSKGKLVPADAQVALAGAFKSNQGLGHPDEDEALMDFEGGIGSQSQIFHTRTHLGAILQPGDVALGYFLTNRNFNSDAFAALPSERVPDVILVKKSYPNRRKKSKSRSWRLRSIAKEPGEEGETGSGRGVIGRMGGRDQRKVDDDYELFLRELEEDPDLRGTINLYKAPTDGGTDDAHMRESSGKAGGKRGKRAQFAMDVDDTPSVSKVDQVAAENETAEEEADFPEVQLGELLDTFDDMTLDTAEPKTEQPL